MSISNNIDGSAGGANQLLDLLSLVANPSVYEAKIKTLQDATDENRKFVEAVGPASEILQLRDEAFDAKNAAIRALAEAKVQADNIVATAKQEAKSIASDNTAKIKAKQAKVDAAAQDVELAMQSANETKAKLDAEMTEVNKLKASLETEIKQAKQAKDDASKAKLAYDAAKAEIVSKHKAFIESL